MRQTSQVNAKLGCVKLNGISFVSGEATCGNKELQWYVCGVGGRGMKQKQFRNPSFCSYKI